MAHANLPISFWRNALLTAAYILNHVPSKSVTATPYELRHGRNPSMDYLCPWGSAMHNPTHKHGKLDPRATKMAFIRYPAHLKGYVIYEEHPNGGMTEIETCNVDFLEDEFPSICEIKKDLKLYELQQDLKSSLGKGEDLNSRQVTDDGEPVQGNEVHPYSPNPVKIQPENTKSPHTQDPTAQRDSGSAYPQSRVPIPFLEMGRDSPARQENNEGPRIQKYEREIIHR